MNPTRDDLRAFIAFLLLYHSKKTQKMGRHFETLKNTSVSALMHKRGRFHKHIFHASLVSLASVGVFASGAVNGDSLLASSFPGVTDTDPRTIQTFDPNASGVTLESLIDFETSISDKPRSEIIEYVVEKGETISQIAQKFGVDTDTIKWANDLSSVNTVKPGDKLKILPVSGVAHSVKSGDTLLSVAKKYSAAEQAIVDFPFNDIPDDFKLKVGQVLIVPDGVIEEKKSPSRPKPQYLAQGPSSPSFSAPGGGSFLWPTNGGVSQYFAWYHPGVDIANRAAPGIGASDGGTVVVAGWPDNYGYGNRVVIDHGNGYRTLYAHLSNIFVSSGQKVSKGQIIGKMGSTGRSTGTHLHYEIHYKGIAINPLAILK